jgi:hypothetical protein
MYNLNIRKKGDQLKEGGPAYGRPARQMMLGRYSPRKIRKKAGHFIRHNRFFFLIGAAAAAVLLLVFFVIPAVRGRTDQPAAAEENTYDTPVDQIDAETLAGLAGEDSSVFETAPAADEIKIGVTMLTVSGTNKALVTSLEKAAAEDIRSGAVQAFDMRDARGSQNQQIQDVYTMINNGISVMIVAQADAYNFGKISEICGSNNVTVIGYNVEATEGFAVNVMDTSDASADFARFLRDEGQERTRTLRATEEQRAAVEGVIPVDRHYEEMWDAVYDIRMSIEEGEPFDSIIVFDYNANDILRAWLRSDMTPRAMAGVGTVAYIKTWYQLLNGGVEVVVSEPEDGEAETITVSADESAFAGCAMTSVGNAGDVLYAFAYNIADGDALPHDGYLYQLAGYELITNANIDRYYEMVRDEDSGLVFSAADIGDIDALFTGTADN